MAGDRLELAWLDSVSAPVFVLDLDQSTVLGANEAVRRMLPKDIPNAPAPLADFLGREAADTVTAAVLTMPADGSPHVIRVTCTTATGPMDLVLHVRSLAGAGPLWTITVDVKMFFYSSVVSDDAEKPFREIIQGLPIGIDILDATFRCIFFNGFSHALFTYESYSYVTMMDWFERAFPDDAARGHAIRQWEDTVAALDMDPSQEQTIEWTVLCCDGLSRTLHNRISRIGSYYTFVYWDITEQRRLEARLRALASTDTLTGLHSRRHFFDEAGAILGTTPPEATNLCVLMIDVDHFKAVNDTFGHQAGDQALIAVAGWCRSVLRQTDVLARFGGEEFVVLLPDTTRDEATVIGHRLLQAVSAQPVATSAGPLSLTVSIGLATADTTTFNIDQLIEKADAALYAAKRAGRNRVCGGIDLHYGG